jgi:hypothetical protein
LPSRKNGIAYADILDCPVLHGRPLTIIAQPARQVQLAMHHAIGLIRINLMRFLLQFLSCWQGLEADFGYWT